MRAKHALRMFKNRMLRNTLRPNRGEVTGEWKRLHTKENEMGGACSMYGRRVSCIRVLVRRPEEERPFGRPRRRWEDNNNMYLQEVKWRGMDWIDLAQDRDR
jgi:hypothetical protein